MLFHLLTIDSIFIYYSYHIELKPPEENNNNNNSVDDDDDDYNNRLYRKNKQMENYTTIAKPIGPGKSTY